MAVNDSEVTREEAAAVEESSILDRAGDAALAVGSHAYQVFQRSLHEAAEVEEGHPQW
jgi:hypothetical protein